MFLAIPWQVVALLSQALAKRTGGFLARALCFFPPIFWPLDTTQFAIVVGFLPAVFAGPAR